MSTRKGRRTKNDEPAWANSFLARPLFFLLILLCAIPSLASADAFKPSKEAQVKLGLAVAKDIRIHGKILPDADPRVQRLRRVGKKLLDTMGPVKEPWKFSFDMIDAPDVNAFALPGGPVFFFTGLYDRLKTEDEIAGVLGHEMTHVLREHWAYAYADSQKRNIVLSLALILGRVNPTLGDLSSLGNELIDLRYSRQDETQADQGGLQFMVLAGYNPQGMVDVFSLLQKLNKEGNAPEWMSDHPDDKNRIKRMNEVIARVAGPFPVQQPLPPPPPVFRKLFFFFG